MVAAGLGSEIPGGESAGSKGFLEMVKIRLTRRGATKRPFYRVQAIDERKQRDGRALEFLGTYDPRTTPEIIDLRTEAIEAWVAKGAQLSDTVRSLMRRQQRRAGAQPAVEEGAS